MNDFYIYLIEFSVIIWALFYLTDLKIMKTIILNMIVFIILPTIIIYNVKEIIGIIFLFISTTTIFYIVTRTKRVFIDITVIIIIGLISDHLAQLLFSSLFISVTNIKITQYIIFLLLFICLTVLYKKATGFIDFFIKKYAIFCLLFFLLLILTVGVFYINIFLQRNNFDSSLIKINLALQLTYLIVIICMFFTLAYILKKDNLVKQKKIEQANFKEYIDSLEAINNEMQRFRHDYLNILLTIEGYLDEKNIIGLKEYFGKEILKTSNITLTTHKNFSNLDKLKTIEIKSLLATKLLQASKSNIKVTAEIPYLISNINMNTIDLTRVLGIFLDNALEACREMEHKELNIALINIKKEKIVLVIKNTFEPSDTPLNFKKLFEENYSTKKGNSGIGLSNVKKILNKYPNVILNTRIENNHFIQEMEIKY